MTPECCQTLRNQIIVIASRYADKWNFRGTRKGSGRRCAVAPLKFSSQRNVNIFKDWEWGCVVVRIINTANPDDVTCLRVRIKISLYKNYRRINRLDKFSYRFHSGRILIVLCSPPSTIRTRTRENAVKTLKYFSKQWVQHFSAKKLSMSVYKYRLGKFHVFSL